MTWNLNHRIAICQHASTYKWIRNLRFGKNMLAYDTHWTKFLDKLLYHQAKLWENALPMTEVYYSTSGETHSLLCTSFYRARQVIMFLLRGGRLKKVVVYFVSHYEGLQTINSILHFLYGKGCYNLWQRLPIWSHWYNISAYLWTHYHDKNIIFYISSRGKGAYILWPRLRHFLYGPVWF